MKKIIVILMGVILGAFIASSVYAGWVESYEASSQEVEFTKEIEHELLAQKQLDDTTQLRTTAAKEDNNTLSQLTEAAKTTNSNSDSRTRGDNEDPGNIASNPGSGSTGKASLGGGGDSITVPPRDTGLATATVVDVKSDAAPGIVTDIPQQKLPSGR